MARDPLAVLWRIRDLAVAETARELAAAVARERADAERLDQQRSQMAHEESEAKGDLITAYAAWLPGAQRRAADLQATLQNEAGRVLRLRQTLTARRTAAETVAKAIERRNADAELIRTRREQAVMDEVAGRRPGRADFTGR